MIKKWIKRKDIFYRALNLISQNKLKKEKSNVVKIKKCVLLRNNNIKMLGRNNILSIRENSRLFSCHISIDGDNNELFVDDSCSLTNLFITIRGSDCKIIIGKRVSINGSHIVCGEINVCIKIGDDCLIGYNNQILASDSHPIFDKEGNQINKGGEIDIGNHVWISSNCTILKNTKIGNGTVVGARAFISNKIISEGLVVANDGTKTIHENVTWHR